MKSRVRLGAAVAALAIGLLGCGGSDPAPTTPGTETTGPGLTTIPDLTTTPDLTTIPDETTTTALDSSTTTAAP